MTRYKYPRTPHLPFSLGQGDDDKTLVSDQHLYAFNDVVVTVKMDGENTTVYPDGTCHARSIDSKHKDYHSWLLSNIQNWCYNIPKGHIVCGEYLYAKHSIGYDDLDDYFLAFSVWSGDTCLSWKDTVRICNDLGIQTVPVLYIGKYDTRRIEEIARKAVEDGQEGIVVRNADSFSRTNFQHNVAKFVRANHVQTDTHWSQQKIIANRLADNSGA